MKIITREEKGYKPMLAPNSEGGESVDVERDLVDTSLYTFSNKKDGVRTAIFTEKLLSRALKPFKSLQVNRMAEDLALVTQHKGVIEAEFYAHGFNVGEIIHFSGTVDVTSDSTKKKYDKEWEKTKQGTSTYTKKVKGVDVEVGWKFPGRDPQWCTEWHDELGFHVFDQLDDLKDSRTKIERYEGLVDMFGNKLKGQEEFLKTSLITHFDLKYTDAVYQAYDQAVLDGYEGLMAVLKDSKYKFGRWSYNSGVMYKLKDDNNEFDGKVIEVIEGTKAKEGTARKINKLGRSETSKLKEDREPSGMATGIKVMLEDGRTLTVSLKNYNHEQRIELLLCPEQLVGKWIRFHGMNPTKKGGVPRHAMFTKGNIRDDKD